ncbi:MAG: metallophosphatase family protein [Candidatus Sumerlaeaceae bacterium]|nr:metallophosphatase family protein [Candidatus Sumerlaeaceae bacterium]
MRIGLISDTHSEWHPAIAEALAGVNIILHAGDIGDLSVLQRLETTAPVYAVRGNCDHRYELTHLPRSRIVEITPHLRIGLVHGDQYPLDELEETLVRCFQDQNVHAVVFGHTHRPLHTLIGPIVVVNPGAVHCYSRQALPTVAILETLGHGLSVVFCPLS